MTSVNNEHVFAFSNNGKLFAVLNAESILRIWDTDTNELKQQYTPNLDICDQCTALTWITTSNSFDRKDKPLNEALYISLGTSKGTVSLYSYAEAQVEQYLKGDGHIGKIICMAEGEHGILYTCGEDCQLIEWSVVKKKQLSSWSVGTELPSSICYIESLRRIAIGSRQIKVYSIETHELLYVISGHASKISVMQSFILCNDMQYIVSAAHMEQNICIWAINEKTPDTCITLITEDIVRCLTYKIHDNYIIILACVSRCGDICLYNVDVRRVQPNEPVKPALTIRITEENKIDTIAAYTVTLKHSYKKDEILIGYGDTRFLLFDHIIPDLKKNTQILVRQNPKNMPKQKLAKNNTSGCDNSLKVLKPIICMKDVHHKVSAKSSKKTNNVLDMPMETRLNNLDGEMVRKEQSFCKVQLLMQALHSKDAILLRNVLITKDSTTIELTLQRLPVNYIDSLIKQLSLLMEQKHINVGYSVNWLKILCRIHSSQLMATDARDILHKFGTCLGVIDHRIECLKDLFKLNGRLELLLSQMQRNQDCQSYSLREDNAIVYDDVDNLAASDLGKNYYYEDNDTTDETEEEMEIDQD